MELLLDHPDSPYIRGIGFLYLRYAGDPKTAFRWIEPYLYDDESIAVAATTSKTNQRGSREPDTIGAFVRKIFSERDYYGTMLPRLPIQIERDIQVNLLLAEKIENRAKKHLSSRDTMNYFQKIGSKVMALYGDEENSIAWYEAVVDRVVTHNEETSQPYSVPRFIVTFTEYGNTEKVTLGELEMPGVPLDPVVAQAPKDSSDDDRGINTNHYVDSRRFNYRGHDDGCKNNFHGRQSLGRARYGGKADLYQEVRQRERESVTVSGANAVPRRPPNSKANKAPYKRSDHLGDGGDHIIHHPNLGPQIDGKAPSLASTRAAAAPKKRSAEEIVSIQEKKQKLLAKYG
jgi:pre-mRNA-splicing factor 38B